MSVSSASPSRKRKLVGKFETVVEPIANANLHGVVGFVSPLKKGKTKSYFDGTVLDGTGSM